MATVFLSGNTRVGYSAFGYRGHLPILVQHRVKRKNSRPTLIQSTSGAAAGSARPQPASPSAARPRRSTPAPRRPRPLRHAVLAPRRASSSSLFWDVVPAPIRRSYPAVPEPRSGTLVPGTRISATYHDPVTVIQAWGPVATSFHRSLLLSSVRDMVGNSVMWQHLEVEDLLLYHKEKILLYYKEKIHESGRAFVLREVHHEECARRLNEKYGTNFTWKQTYNKYHKLKGEWKLIMEAKSAKGTSFDDVQKKIIYDEIEVVKMKAKGDKKAKYYNVPIPLYDEMEFVFTGKHAAGEFNVVEAPFVSSARQDDDLVGNVDPTQELADLNGDPSQHDSDTHPESDNPNPVGSKRKHEEKEKKGKWAKQGVPIFMQALSEAVSFTHGTDPHEGIFKAIEDMDEYPLPVRLDLLTYLAQNRHIASMLKGRQEETFKQWVARWVAGHYPL